MYYYNEKSVMPLLDGGQLHSCHPLKLLLNYNYKMKISELILVVIIPYKITQWALLKQN